MIAMLILVATAQAESEHWWGVGPMLGTTGFPIEYPAAMPALAQDKNGNNLVAPVTFDLRMGAHAVYYLGNGGRIGARLHYDGNFATWGAQEITAEYEVVLTKVDKFQFMAGGGLGFGHDRFGAATDSSHPDAYLDVTYFPLRAQIGALWRDRTRAYELQLFGTWHIAGEQKFSKSGKAEDEEVGTAVSDPFAVDDTKSDLAFYGAIGAEVTVYFGNFKNKGKSNDGDGDSKKSDKKNDKKKDKKDKN